MTRAFVPLLALGLTLWSSCRNAYVLFVPPQAPRHPWGLPCFERQGGLRTCAPACVPPSATLPGGVDPLVSVVMVTWNGLCHLRRSLPAVLAQELPDGQQFELLVVDNASTDGSRAHLADLAARDGRVRVLLNDHNEGFAAPNNRAFRDARGTFVATLNNDTLPEPGWLAALLRVAQADERVGSVASRMVFDHAPETINSAGISIDRAGIAWDRLVGRPVAESETQPVEVFGASAGAALYRRSMLEELGGFDARFFIYLEDVDLAWRARLAGWRAVYAPDAVVRHAHSASAKE
ncbi:MAG: glycosyltransferase family 2 protein, partial [Chloroflexota bacterium]